MIVGYAPWEGISFRLGCGEEYINSAQRSNWYHEFLVQMISFSRLYISLSAPQSDRNAFPRGISYDQTACPTVTCAWIASHATLLSQCLPWLPCRGVWKFVRAGDPISEADCPPWPPSTLSISCPCMHKQLRVSPSQPPQKAQ